MTNCPGVATCPVIASFNSIFQSTLSIHRSHKSARPARAICPFFIWRFFFLLLECDYETGPAFDSCYFCFSLHLFLRKVSTIPCTGSLFTMALLFVVVTTFAWSKMQTVNGIWWMTQRFLPFYVVRALCCEKNLTTVFWTCLHVCLSVHVYCSSVACYRAGVMTPPTNTLRFQHSKNSRSFLWKSLRAKKKQIFRKFWEQKTRQSAK